MNLQTQYDLRQAQEENREIYEHIPVAQLAHLTYLTENRTWFQFRINHLN
jgi:plasmid maintenance system antidote protein VapI